MYENGIPLHMGSSEGRIVYKSNGSTWFTETQVKDHLGSVRAVCSLNSTTRSRITRQVDAYYPFGMNIKELSQTSDAYLANEYMYNGKMMQDEMGLNWLDYGARFYDAVLGRWHSVDPKVEKYFSWTPFVYVGNNPIRLIDPNGKEWVDGKGNLIYDPKANNGKGAYTEYASNNDKRLGNSLQGTKTGKVQFNKLVNSVQDVTTKLNFSSDIIYTNKEKTGVQCGKTDNTVNTEMGTNKSEAESSVITINVATMELLLENGGTFSGEEVSGLTFDEFLGAVFGHEIEHTTAENIQKDASGGNSDDSAHKVSKQIITETKEKKKEDEKK